MECEDEAEVVHEFDSNSGGMLTAGELAVILSKLRKGKDLHFCVKLDGCENEWCTPIRVPLPDDKPEPDQCQYPNVLEVWQN